MNDVDADGDLVSSYSNKSARGGPLIGSRRPEQDHRTPPTHRGPRRRPWMRAVALRVN